MNLIYIGFGLMTVVAAYGLIRNRSLSKRLKTDRDIAEACKDTINDLAAFKMEVLDSVLSKDAFVVDCGRHLSVCRKGASCDIEVLREYYDPSDPEDAEYKRRYMEEVVEKLNERP